MINVVQRSRSARRLLVVGAVALLVLASVVLLLVLSGGRGASSKASSEKPAPSGGLLLTSRPTFESLDQMVATADLVVMGTVADVRGGGVDAAGTAEEVGHLNTAVVADEVLKGPAIGGPVVVKMQGLAYSGPGKAEWRRPEERVLLFLSHSREQEGLYIPAGISYDQTAYVLRAADGEIAATVPDDPLSSRVAGLSVAELRQQVEEAKARDARGEVKPLEF